MLERDRKGIIVIKGKKVASEPENRFSQSALANTLSSFLIMGASSLLLDHVKK